MRKQPSFSTAKQQRVVRVFVSSTFRDMQAERDELIKRTFPQLRKLCDERGVVWSEVDLRWGITEEQSQRGEVLPICLAEIQRCRPYFIGLLGERYGWVPDGIPQELIDQEPWLKGHLRHSVTELEILHGVLRNPKMADHAIFYFRDCAYIDPLPPDKRPDYLELPIKEEIAKYGQPEAERRAEERRQKLVRLKDRIRTSGLPVRENYANPEALGEIVLRDLTEIIDRLYPKGSEPDPLDRESLDHESFAQSRAKVYIGRQAYCDRLDEHCRNNGPPLVVLGESGSGKSALVSNWALQYHNEHAKELLVMHFIGATPYSSDWAAMLRRIMGEFKRRFGIQHEIPDKPDELRVVFANWLHMAAANGRVVLILDALNQLEDRDGAPDLAWLPPVIPSNIRLILSTLPGRSLDDLQKRGWPTLKVESLTIVERKQLISDYLAQYSKSLNEARAERIAEAEQTSNPLYLRALLDELRVFGVHEELDARIAHYLRAPTVDKLYEKMLDRYEQDYERERPLLVRDAMTLLWAARRGLSETELLALLGSNGQPLPRGHSSPLFLATEQSLVSHSGLIGFFHDYMRHAVQDRYLPTEDMRSAAHLRLAEYFNSQDSSWGHLEAKSINVRRAQELPWQLVQIGEWERLRDTLHDVAFLSAVYEDNKYDALAYWRSLSEHVNFWPPKQYEYVLDETANYSQQLKACNSTNEYQHVFEATKRFAENLTSLWQMALAVHEDEFAEKVRKTQDRVFVADDTDSFWAQLVMNGGRLQRISERKGELEKAFDAWEFPKSMAGRVLKSPALEVNALIHQCEIRLKQEKLDDASRLLFECEAILDGVKDLSIHRAFLAAKGQLAVRKGNRSDALAFFTEEERICQMLNLSEALYGCWLNQGSILAELGRYEEATRLLRKAAHGLRSIGFNEATEAFRRLSTVLVAVASERLSTGDVHASLQSLIDGMSAARQSGNIDGVRTYQDLWRQTYPLLARVSDELLKEGDAEAALRNQKTLITASRGIGDAIGLQRAMVQMAQMLASLGLYKDALKQYEEQYALSVEFGNWSLAIFSLCQQAEVGFQMSQEKRQAISTLKQALDLCKKHGVSEHIRGITLALEYLGDGSN